MHFLVEHTNLKKDDENERLKKRYIVFMREMALLYNDGVQLNSENGRREILKRMNEEFPRDKKKWGNEEWTRYVRDLKKKEWIKEERGEFVIPPALLLEPFVKLNGEGFGVAMLPLQIYYAPNAESTTSNQAQES